MIHFECVFTGKIILSPDCQRQSVISVLTKGLGAGKVPRKLNNLTDNRMKRHFSNGTLKHPISAAQILSEQQK